MGLNLKDTNSSDSDTEAAFGAAPTEGATFGAAASKEDDTFFPPPLLLSGLGTKLANNAGVKSRDAFSVNVKDMGNEEKHKDLYLTSHSTDSDPEAAASTEVKDVTKLKDYPSENMHMHGTGSKILIVASDSFQTKRAGLQRHTSTGQAISSRGPLTTSDDGHPHLSLILGLERTFFAALNNAWLLAIGGIGLMSVGEDNKSATHGGVAVLLSGVISALMAVGFHLFRIWRLTHGKESKYIHSVIWVTSISSLTVCALVLELYFGLLFPYLDRERSVRFGYSND